MGISQFGAGSRYISAYEFDKDDDFWKGRQDSMNNFFPFDNGLDYLNMEIAAWRFETQKKTLRNKLDSTVAAWRAHAFVV